jgi:hypothetical protein
MSQNKPPYTVSVYKHDVPDEGRYVRRLPDGTRTFEEDATKAVEAGYTLDRTMMIGDTNWFLAIWKLEES